MAHGESGKLEVTAPRSRLYQGRYGRICPQLPAWSPEGLRDSEIDEYFSSVANGQMVEEPDAAGNADPKYGSDIPAGYTYFGQFVDHDITFDSTSSLERQNDPNGIYNFRTPRLDLDSLYGRGPGDQPYLYDLDDRYDPKQGARSDGKVEKLLLGRVQGCALRDLPRNSQGWAVVGDPRNDENSIVSQLHLAFLLAHNALVDRARKLRKPEPFEAARQTLRWLYQHVVWNDFIRRVTSERIHDSALRLVDRGGGCKEWELGLKHVYSWKSQPFIPVEFSVAAYRFGHSMVRNEYQTNAPYRGEGRPAPLFDSGVGADDLRGFRPTERPNVVQWNWFLPMGSPAGFPQKARGIDTKLSRSLTSLQGQTGTGNVLAYRNLKRGAAFGLPAGTVVAKRFGLELAPLSRDDPDPAKNEPDSLWFYVLREAESDLSESKRNKLGPVGSLIVCATFAGLLKGDPLSFLNIWPTWTPDDDDLLCPGKDNRDGDQGSDGKPRWTLASIIRIAGLPVSEQDIIDQTQGEFPDNPIGR